MRLPYPQKCSSDLIHLPGWSHQSIRRRRRSYRQNWRSGRQKQVAASDHSRCLNPDTAYTTNPVRFITTGDLKKYKFTVDKKDGEEEEGALADVAPTVLALLGLDQPEGGVFQLHLISSDQFFAHTR